MTHAEYCHNRMTRLNASVTVFPDGVHIWKVGHEYLTNREMDERYPVHGKLTDWKSHQYTKGTNPNKKNNFKDL